METFGIMDGPYKLVNELYAHAGPVRSMTFIDQSMSMENESPSLQIVTGCQADSPNIRKWTMFGQEIVANGEPIVHNHWGAIVTGCYDAVIRLYHFTSEVPLMSLVGHEKGVISFSWTSKNRLISGSWDGTARIWDLDLGGLCVFVLKPHENGVNVLGLSSGLIVTTSTGEAVNGRPANFKIRFWDSETGNQIGSTIEDHQGSIRSVCAVPSFDGFATTSNDGTVSVRTPDGSVVASLVHPLQDDGIPPFILNCGVLSTPDELDIVSCGEDGSVIVWRDMSMLQSIPHPCCVWCVLPLQGTGFEGDFLTAGNDGIVRYFSRNPSLTSLQSSTQLSLQLISEVEDMRRKRQKGPSEEDLAKACRWENRGSERGKSEGQVTLFNKNGQLIAAQWSMASQVWIEVGEVTGKGDSGDVDGVEYDHVLPVEIETPQGLRNLKLGYNNGENPFVAAQRFIDTNELSQGYLAQIADWITARSGRSNAPTLDMSANGNTSSSNARTPKQSDIPTPQALNPCFQYTVKGQTVFDDIPSGFAEKVKGKIQEWNDSRSPLTDSDFANLDSLLNILSQTSYYHSSNVLIGHLRALQTIFAWKDVNKAFPAFDILRIVAIHPSGASVLSSPQGNDLLRLAFETLVTNASASPESVSNPTLLTSIRFVVNCFRHESLRVATITSTHFPAIMNALNGQVGNKSKPVRLAVSTLLINYSIALNPSLYMSTIPNSTWISATMEQYLQLVYRLLAAETESEDVSKNCLFSLGTAIGGVITNQSLTSNVNVVMIYALLDEMKSRVKNDGFLNAVIASKVKFTSEIFRLIADEFISLM